MIRTYRELSRLPTFLERYTYLRLKGVVGASTFGYDRHLNQVLYTTQRWRRVRDIVIIRDNGCDLGINDYKIHSKIIVHHMNPISIEDIENIEDEMDSVFDPEFLICTTSNTHSAIHYSDESLLQKLPIERRPGDTCPWL